MKKQEAISTQDRSVLSILAKVRGILAETAALYPSLGASSEALRKRMERLRSKGFLATSSLPSGRPLFRLSSKGAAFVGAPASWAVGPSPNVAAEALSVSASAWNAALYHFPSRKELQSVLDAVTRDSSDTPLPERILSSRFVLRLEEPRDAVSSPWTCLDYWFCELRTADEIAVRIDTVVSRLRSVETFKRLMDERLLGVTIAVPSEGVKATLVAKSFPVKTHVIVVPELQHLLSSL